MPISNRPLNHQERRQAQKGFAKQVKATKKTGNWGQWENYSHCLHTDHAIATRMNNRLLKDVTEMWSNNYVSVQIAIVQTPIGKVKRLGIRRHDEKSGISWAEKQRIKNELCGKGSVAVEVFPADSDLIDEANMFWLWVLPNDYILPFSL